MSYSISISGHATDVDTEKELTDALAAAIASVPADAGVTMAQAFTQYSGTVSLLPAVTTPPPIDPKQELDAAVTALDDVLAAALATPADDGSFVVSAADAETILSGIADVQTEVEAYETAVSAELASAEGNSTGSSAPSPVISDASGDTSSTSPVDGGIVTTTDGASVSL